jgi:hypothetical protein
MELKGSWDNGAPPDPWLLRHRSNPGGGQILDQVELQRALRKLRVPVRRPFLGSNRILGPVPRHASPINSPKAPDLWTPPLRHVAKKYRLCLSAVHRGKDPKIIGSRSTARGRRLLQTLNCFVTAPSTLHCVMPPLALFTLAAADGSIDEVGLEAMICQAPLTTPGSLHDIQRARILVVYAETAGNISETARRLGVSRNTIYRALGQKKPR